METNESVLAEGLLGDFRPVASTMPVSAIELHLKWLAELVAELPDDDI